MVHNKKTVTEGKDSNNLTYYLQLISLKISNKITIDQNRANQLVGISTKNLTVKVWQILVVQDRNRLNNKETLRNFDFTKLWQISLI